MKTSLKPGAMPRAKVGDFENALALLVATGADKSTKAYLTQLHEATAAYDKAKDDAQAAERKVTTRESEAQAAEADATRARQALADETATARDELGPVRLTVQLSHALQGRDLEGQEASHHREQNEGADEHQGGLPVVTHRLPFGFGGGL